MSSDFYTNSIVPYAGIIIKICRAYTDSQEDFEDYYQEVCLQIWRSRDQFRGESKWSTWIYRLTLNCLVLKYGYRLKLIIKLHFCTPSLEFYNPTIRVILFGWK